LFSEHFDGAAVNSEKWVVQENTNMSGHPAYGGSVEVADGYLSFSINGSTFSWVYTRTTPFPSTGDFSVEFNLTYTCIGIGVTASKFSATSPHLTLPHGQAASLLSGLMTKAKQQGYSNRVVQPKSLQYASSRIQTQLQSSPLQDRIR